MSRKVSSGSMVLLLVVLVVVLLLAARAWKAMTPAALDVSALQATSPAGRTSAGAGEESKPSGRLPGLREMRDSTEAHTDQVRKAMDQIDGKTAR
ncbi:MAG: hypothetical protein ACE5HD_12530 [Acidobacteriota bacterium]